MAYLLFQCCVQVFMAIFMALLQFSANSISVRIYMQCSKSSMGLFCSKPSPIRLLPLLLVDRILLQGCLCQLAEVLPHTMPGQDSSIVAAEATSSAVITSASRQQELDSVFLAPPSPQFGSPHQKSAGAWWAPMWRCYPADSP